MSYMHFVGVIMSMCDFNRHIVIYTGLFLLKHVDTVRLDTSSVSARPYTTVGKISNHCVEPRLYY